MRNARLPRAAIFACLVVPLALAAGTMKRTIAHIPLPDHTSPVPLRGLIYKAWFTAEIGSVRLEALPAEAADPVEIVWVFSGSNSDGQAHRVSLTVTLLDESGGDLAFATGKALIRAGTRDQAITLRMSAPAASWRAARMVRLGADWFS